MDGMVLEESSCLDKLLALKFTPDLKWDSYIDSVARDAAKMVESLFRSKKFLTSDSENLLCISTRVKFDLKWSTAHISAQVLLLIEFSIVCVDY